MAHATNIAAGTLNTTASPVRSMLLGFLNRVVAAEKSYRDRAHIAKLSDATCRDVGLDRMQMLRGTYR